MSKKLKKVKPEEANKYYCTACGIESPIRYSNWSSIDAGQLVGKNESLCSRCFKQRTGLKFI